MVKKYYAVKIGRKTGIYDTWEEAKEQVFKYPKAKYKSFSSKEEAENYMKEDIVSQEEKVDPLLMAYTLASRSDEKGKAIAFVDGSYQDRTKHYGYGGVLLFDDSALTFSGGGTREELAVMRNVSGEMMAAMRAVRYAIKHGDREIIIHYDFVGLEHWTTGDFKTKNEWTKAYHEYMESQRKKITINFVKVPAHKGLPLNEEADRLAKRGLELEEVEEKFYV